MFTDDEYDVIDGPEDEDIQPRSSADFANPLYQAPPVAPTPRTGPAAFRSNNPVWSPNLEHSGFSAGATGPSLANDSSSQPAQQRPGLALEKDEIAFSDVLQSLEDGQVDATQALLDYEAVCLAHASQFREEAAQQQQQRGLRSIRLQDLAIDLEAEAATWKLLGVLYGIPAPEPIFGDQQLPECGGVQTTQQQIAAIIKGDEELTRVWRVVTWLEALAGEALDREEAAAQRIGGAQAGFSEREGLPYETATALDRSSGRQSAGFISRLDPDAPNREKRAWASGDAKDDQHITERLWRLVRAGRLAEAREMCRQCGQSWRAASLGGPPGPGSTPSGVAQWEEQSALNQGLAALAAEVDLGGHALRASWRWACFQAAEQIGDTAAHEAAVYGVLGGNLKRVLPLCSSWHDRCWALSRSWLEARLDQLLQPRDCKIDISTDAVTAAVAEGQALQATAADGLSVFGGAWPTRRMSDDIPQSWEDVRAGAGMKEGYTGAGQDFRSQQQLMQWLLIVGPEEGHYGRLLMDLLPSCLQAPANGSGSSLQSQKMLRFAAHLALSLVDLNLLPAPHDLSASHTYRPFQEKVNALVHAYLGHLLQSQQYALVPGLALPLLADVRREVHGRMLQQLTQEGDLLACTQAYELAAAWFNTWSNSKKGDVEDHELDIITEQVAEKSRWALEGGPLLRARTAQWLWLGPTTLAAAVRHTNALLREFALAGQASSEAALVLLHSLPPEIQDMLQGPSQGLGDTAWVSPLVEAGLVPQEEVEAIQLGLLQAHCFWVYFKLGRRYQEWEEKMRGVQGRGCSHALREEGSQLLSTYLMFLSQQADGIPPLLECLSPQQLPAEGQQSLALWVLPLISSLGADEASSSEAYATPAAKDAAELAQRLQRSLVAAEEQAGAAEFSLQAEASSSDGLDGCVKITVVADSTESLLLGTSVIALAYKAALPVLDERPLPKLQVVNMEGDIFGQAHFCRLVCYPKAILEAAAVRLALMELGAKEDEGADLVPLVAGTDRSTRFQGLSPYLAPGEMQQLLLMERQVVLASSNSRA